MKLTWKIEKLDLPLKVIWRIARTTTATTVSENFLITLSDGERISYGEVSPNSRYGVKERDVFNEFNRFLKLVPSNFTHDTLLDFLVKNEFAHSMSFGIESAFVHLQNKKVSEYFNLQTPTQVETSFTIPIMEISQLQNFVKEYSRFKSLKIKVNKDTGFEVISEILKHTNQKLRIDANESWTDFESFEKILKMLANKNIEFRIEFIEQPFPAHCKDEYKKLKAVSKIPIIADESVEDNADFTELKNMFHGINVKLQKAGSYKNAIRLLTEARKHGMQTMIGCMVESSLGCMGGFELSSLADYLDLDGFILVKDDPFKILKEENGIISLA